MIALWTVGSQTRNSVVNAAGAKPMELLHGSVASVPGSVVRSVSGTPMLAIRLLPNPAFPSSDLPMAILEAGAATTGTRQLPPLKAGSFDRHPVSAMAVR